MWSENMFASCQHGINGFKFMKLDGISKEVSVKREDDPAPSAWVSDMKFEEKRRYQQRRVRGRGQKLGEKMEKKG